MSYSANSIDAPAPVHFARGGLRHRTGPRVPQDPILAWLELMEVVEALCPQWPPRYIAVGGQYRL